MKKLSLLSIDLFKFNQFMRGLQSDDRKKCFLGLFDGAKQGVPPKCGVGGIFFQSKTLHKV